MTGDLFHGLNRLGAVGYTATGKFYFAGEVHSALRGESRDGVEWVLLAVETDLGSVRTFLLANGRLNATEADRLRELRNELAPVRRRVVVSFGRLTDDEHARIRDRLDGRASEEDAFATDVFDDAREDELLAA